MSNHTEFPGHRQPVFKIERNREILELLKVFITLDTTDRRRLIEFAADIANKDKVIS